MLAAALRKLYHENMDTTAILISEVPSAMKITRDIQVRADEIETALYHHQKAAKHLKDKFKK